jgi:putative membrane protein
VFPILVGALVLIATRRRFPLTHLTYTLLAVHALILMVGGHYTYARVPLGFWAEHAFGFTRNDTTASATSFRASFPPSSYGKSSCEPPHCAAVAGCSFS